ncbi:HDOD domain-containing protein [Pseudomonas fuscovaginae UPB0736]|uniref:HDOD domain-containing protein n=1 Tax=Pseudomonas asplenii TaxID=53407 RepID=UPI00028801EE|nr:HDOD domain-containing protein [Pseudomonas fuscovaginae]UUQ67086.1 HDOD domain-containing protein [Pseudomonas fuscovaginae UPB0736]
MTNETNASSARPNTLQGWIKLLQGVCLPVPQDSHDRVCRAIADSRSSLRDIADLMQDSPALALSVICEANHHTQGSMSEPAENLEIAINRLGLKRTAELLERLPARMPEEIPVALRQLQLISQHASQQANGLFAARLARLWQDIHWGSLLFLAPLWPLALTHPKLLEAWELRVLQKHEPAGRVERELFGVRLLELCQAMAEFWRLPVWVTQGYQVLLNERKTLARVMHIARDNNQRLRQQQQLDADPDLRRWLNQPANTVLLANGLALAAQQAWNGPHCLRWQYLSSLYLQQPMSELQQQIHQQAAQSANQHSMQDLWHPAEALIWPWHVRRLHADQVPAAAPSAEAMVIWRRHCAQLLAEPSRFSNAMHLTTVARDALVACGLRRVMILMTDRSRTALRVNQTAGLPAQASNLTLQLAQSPLLQRLMSQPAQVRLSPANAAQFRALLPNSLRAEFPGEHLLLRSLSNNGRVVMVVLGDQDGVPFSEITVQAFGKTVHCIEKALHAFTNRSA